MASVSVNKAKLKYAEEVASIAKLEVFGVDACGVTWKRLFRKHLAFDVIKCGGVSCDGNSCLKNEIEIGCNC